MRAVSLVGAALMVTACATLEAKSSYLVGAWGGSHIGITFEGGLANVELDCASGTIDGPVYPAKAGAFTAKGIFRAGMGGPVRVGQIFKSQTASYSGTVIKDVMTLSIRLEDGTVSGPFTLFQGRQPQVTRCL
jgi:hypothetical protein